MAAWSILLGVLSLVSTGLGVLLTPVPVLGALFAFGAPTLALAGVITGGVARSRGRRDGRPTDAATAGIIVAGLSFVPALLTALTCGVCNALCSAGGVQTHRNFNFTSGQPLGGDAGVAFPAPPPLPDPAQPSGTAVQQRRPAQAGEPDKPASPGGSATPAPPPATPAPRHLAPPPAFPPPPMEP